MPSLIIKNSIKINFLAFLISLSTSPKKLSPIFRLSQNYRDHRKIIVIDGKVAYTGGCNIADEYINLKQVHGYWKDNGVKVLGQAVDGFTLTFLKQWEVLTKRREEYSKYLNLFEQEKSQSHTK